MEQCSIIFCVQLPKKMYSHKGFWSKHNVSITSDSSSPKTGLCLFLVALALHFLGLFLGFSGIVQKKWQFLSSIIVLFPECAKFNTRCLSAAAVSFLFPLLFSQRSPIPAEAADIKLAAQFIPNSSRAVGTLGRTRLSGRALPGSTGKWDTKICILLEALKCSKWLLCVAKAKVLKRSRSQLCQFNLWELLIPNMSFPEVQMFLCPSVTCILSIPCCCFILEIALSKGKRWKSLRWN